MEEIFVICKERLRGERRADGKSVMDNSEDMRKKAPIPKKYVGNDGKEPTERPSSGMEGSDSSVDLMEGAEVPVGAAEAPVGSGEGVVNAEKQPASCSHQPAVEEPPAKVLRTKEQSTSKDSLEHPVVVIPGAWERKKREYAQNLIAQERVRAEKWEQSVAKEYGLDLAEVPSNEGSKEKIDRGKENDSLGINRNSTASGAYRPYVAGDIVMDHRINTKCRAVLDQTKSRELPTLTLPLLCSIYHCCKFPLMEFTTPPFPRNLPPITRLKYVVCFDVVTSNPKDHSHQWRFLEQVTHRQAINWVRSGHQMTTQERTTVLGLKNFQGKMLTKLATFIRVEEGKLLRE